MSLPPRAPGTRSWRAVMPIAAGYVALVVLVAGFGGWSVLTTIAGAIIAPGQVVVKQERQIVDHPEGGIVGEILVSEGDTVAAGAVLIRLDGTALGSELAATEGKYFELIARRGRLEAERDARDEIVFDPVLVDAARTAPALDDLMDGQRRLFEARRQSMARESDQLAERKVQIAAQVTGMEAQAKAQKRQIDLVGKDLENQRVLLEKGLAQASRVSALKREAARLEGQLGNLEASRAEANGRIVETDIQILQLATKRREEAITRLRDLGFRELELAQSRIVLRDKLARLDIRAPVAGTVFGLAVNTVGSVVRPAEPLLYIVPSDRPLIIASRISPIHIDEVHVGQKVILRFSTFDQRTTPELSGHLVNLSADSFVDQASGVAFYRAEIVPDENEIARLGGLDVLPGMPVESFIRTEERTPLSYLLKPLRDYFNKAFRES